MNYDVLFYLKIFMAIRSEVCANNFVKHVHFKLNQ